MQIVVVLFAQGVDICLWDFFCPKILGFFLGTAPSIQSVVECLFHCSWALLSRGMIIYNSTYFSKFEAL